MPSLPVVVLVTLDKHKARLIKLSLTKQINLKLMLLPEVLPVVDRELSPVPKASETIREKKLKKQTQR